MKFNKDLITEQFLIDNDGNLCWTSDDYLSMRGMCYRSDPELYDFLEHVEKVKTEARKYHDFKC